MGGVKECASHNIQSFEYSTYSVKEKTRKRTKKDNSLPEKKKVCCLFCVKILHKKNGEGTRAKKSFFRRKIEKTEKIAQIFVKFDKRLTIHTKTTYTKHSSCKTIHYKVEN